MYGSFYTDIISNEINSTNLTAAKAQFHNVFIISSTENKNIKHLKLKITEFTINLGQ